MVRKDQKRRILGNYYGSVFRVCDNNDAATGNIDAEFS